MYADKNLAPLPSQFWAIGMVRNDVMANYMNANVTNPFLLSNFASLQQSDPLLYNQPATRSFFTSGTIRKNQWLRPYPQMSSLVQTSGPYGQFRTDEMVLGMERRFAKGFNLNVAYTRLRTQSRTTYWNEFDPEPYWVERNNGRPHRFTATGVTQLPFGKGRALVKQGLPSMLVGGFQFYYGKLEKIPTDNRTLDRG